MTHNNPDPNKFLFSFSYSRLMSGDHREKVMSLILEQYYRDLRNKQEQNNMKEANKVGTYFLPLRFSFLRLIGENVNALPIQARSQISKGQKKVLGSKKSGDGGNRHTTLLCLFSSLIHSALIWQNWIDASRKKFGRVLFNQRDF